MSRLRHIARVCFAFTVVSAAQTIQTTPVSDPQALNLAAQSIAAMTGKISVTDVTLNATVTSIAGSDYFTGTAVLQAKGAGESRIDLSLADTVRSEIRTNAGGAPKGAWIRSAATDISSAAPQSYALHNCWTDAAWFFPVLTSLSQTSNSKFVFSYLGPETHADLKAEHIRVYQVFALDTKGLLQVKRLSAMDYYLDPTTLFPLAIGFTAHPDTDLTTDIQMEVRFADYRPVNGVQIPFHVQKLLNGGVTLDLSVGNAVLNSGLGDSIFDVQ